MTDLIYYRMLGYIVTIFVHVLNILYMDSFLHGVVMEDPQISQYASMQARFFTCWTFFLQIVYAALALICDCATLKNIDKENYKLPKHLRGARDTLFDAILWPSTWVVFSFFWTIFLYDRDLILPDFIDKVLTRTSNHIIHTFIVPVVLWEVMFRPKAEPKSHKRNLWHLTCHFLLYLVVIIYTHYERDFWIYPVMGHLYGTIYFPLLIIMLAAMACFFYYMQWWARRIIWGKMECEKGSEMPKKTR